MRALGVPILLYNAAVTKVGGVSISMNEHAEVRALRDADNTTIILRGSTSAEVGALRTDDNTTGKLIITRKQSPFSRPSHRFRHRQPPQPAAQVQPVVVTSIPLAKRHSTAMSSILELTFLCVMIFMLLRVLASPKHSFSWHVDFIFTAVTLKSKVNPEGDKLAVRFCSWNLFGVTDQDDFDAQHEMMSEWLSWDNGQEPDVYVICLRVPVINSSIVWMQTLEACLGPDYTLALKRQATTGKTMIISLVFASKSTKVAAGVSAEASLPGWFTVAVSHAHMPEQAREEEKQIGQDVFKGQPFAEQADLQVLLLDVEEPLGTVPFPVAPAFGPLTDMFKEDHERLSYGTSSDFSANVVTRRCGVEENHSWHGKHLPLFVHMEVRGQCIA